MGTYLCCLCKEGCMDCLNNEILTGWFSPCLGEWREDLCGCCGNCNLCCYSCWCFPCAMADLSVAVPGKEKSDWWQTLGLLMITPILIEIVKTFVHFGMDP